MLRSQWAHYVLSIFSSLACSLSRDRGGHKWELKTENATLLGIWVSDHHRFISMRNLFRTPPSLINYRSLKGKLCQGMGNWLTRGGRGSPFCAVLSLIDIWSSQDWIPPAPPLHPSPSHLWGSINLFNVMYAKGRQSGVAVPNGSCLFGCLFVWAACDAVQTPWKSKPECNQYFN